jgi:hypothetical protein
LHPKEEEAKGKATIPYRPRKLSCAKDQVVIQVATGVASGGQAR